MKEESVEIDRYAPNIRKHGAPPYTVAVVHGGPGAAGEMAPVARLLAGKYGVLEPIQTATTLEGQVEELKQTLEQHGALQVIIVGFSWGAWLSLMVAARYPVLVKKLILVGCGPFEEHYLAALHTTRMSRLNAEEKLEFDSLLNTIHRAPAKEIDNMLASLSRLTLKTDTYQTSADVEIKVNSMELRGDIFSCVWETAASMRRSGELLGLVENVQCPVLAIHGDYDPHPAEGVEKPLVKALKEFHMIVLKRCGHKPWIEQYARECFYQVLGEALGPRKN